MKRIILFGLLLCLLPFLSNAENGYELWLRYRPLPPEPAAQFKLYCSNISINGQSASVDIIRSEWTKASRGFCLPEPAFSTLSSEKVGIHYLKTDQLPSFIPAPFAKKSASLHKDGFLLYSSPQQKNRIYLIAATDAAWIYGTFHLLRLLQTGAGWQNLQIISEPRADRRLLNHWDNLDRTVERGYAGASIWNWHTLPDYRDKRYTDYARANASIGINGTVLTNVNANATVLTNPYLLKVKALADIFRPYGIKVYLTARFSAPMEMAGLKTADPLNSEVVNWWKNKTDEIYKLIPDFGGFLVKANSEGQPGPQDYQRTHADGANMLARALKPYGGVVMWRAFVYSAETPEDRHKQANLEFEPLDGAFDDNVIIQVKNGAIDFQPREPFHPLFGSMTKTALMPEFQITQEYLGQGTHLVYLAPLFKECLNADTHKPGSGRTVAKIMEESRESAIAGVSNIGSDINWTGHPFAQSNWYAFGRLAWDHQLGADEIASEWIKQSFGLQPAIQKPILDMMMQSREACVRYMTPLGLHHLMGTGHHYGPAPWVKDLGRADWTPVYYHRADTIGIGFDRTATGSNALAQYARYWQEAWGDPNRMDEYYLLWFHHLPWNFRLKSGRSLWNELCLAYQQGVNDVREMQKQWNNLKSHIDRERFEQVQMLLAIQAKEAIWWKDACLLYFQQYSKQALPPAVESPQHSLDYYQSLRFPYAPGN